MSEEIAARLGLDSSTLGRGLKEAKVQVKEFAEKTRESFHDVFKELAAPLSGIGAIGTLEKVFSNVEGIERASEAAGMGAEAFQRLAYAMKTVGIDQEATEKGMETLSKLIGEAAQGQQSSVEIFQRWGIAIRDSNGQVRDTSAILDDISNGMAALHDPASRAAMAMDTLGKSGAKMVAVLADGAKELHARGDGAAVFTDADIAQIKMAHEQIENAENAFTVFAGKVIAFTGSGAAKWGSWIGADGAHKAADDQATVDNLRQIAKMKADTEARIIERHHQERDANLQDQADEFEFLEQSTAEAIKGDKKRHEEEVKHQHELQEQHRRADAERKRAAQERMRIEEETAQKTLTLAQIEAHKDQPYYHTLRELAGNYNVRPASDIAIEARQLEQGTAELQQYTLANGVNTPEFRKRRDYLSGLQLDLENKGYLSPELSMAKMEAHLQHLVTLAGGSGLNVNPSIN